MVVAQNLVEFSECAGLAVGRRFIERILLVQDELRSFRRVDKIQLAVFVYALCRDEPEGFVSNNRAASSEVIVPTQEVGHVFSGNIGTVEGAVAMVGGGEAVEVVAAGFRDDVDDAARG